MREIAKFVSILVLAHEICAWQGRGPRTPMTTERLSRFDYIRDGAEIYRRSFATIRAEAAR